MKTLVADTKTNITVAATTMGVSLDSVFAYVSDVVPEFVRFYALLGGAVYTTVAVWVAVSKELDRQKDRKERKRLGLDLRRHDDK